jgi:prepilin-type N-terminal cleavage/methylation domain-containing protein
MRSSYKLQPTGENKPMKKEQGFSLIELLIVVAIIAIIAAIAVPSMLTARMAANEAGAVQGCRTVGSAEMAYASVNNQQFTDLDTLVAGGFLDSRFDSAGGGFNGFTYADDTALTAPGEGTIPGNLAEPDGFHVIATPTAGGSSGRYVYGIAADQVVRYQGLADDYSGDDPIGLGVGDPIGKQETAG